MASGVNELFFHQLTRAAATVRPVETSCSSWADSMGSTAWPVVLRNLVGQGQRQRGGAGNGRGRDLVQPMQGGKRSGEKRIKGF